jgi:hypothetical protein
MHHSARTGRHPRFDPHYDEAVDQTAKRTDNNACLDRNDHTIRRTPDGVGNTVSCPPPHRAFSSISVESGYAGLIGSVG